MADSILEPGLDLGPQEIGRLFETATGGMEVPSGSGSESRDPGSLDSVFVRLVEARSQEAESTMWPLRKKWALNDEFFLDAQHAVWDRDRKAVVRNPRRESPRIPRVQLNIFKPVVVTAVSRFMATKPQIVVKAGNTDPDAIEGAKTAQKVIGIYEWNRQNMDEALAEALPILLLHGTVVLKVEWDPRGGKYLGKQPVFEQDENGEPVQAYDDDPETGESFPAFEQDGVTPRWQQRIDETGDPVEQDAYEGAATTCVVNSTDFVVDPTVTRFRDAMWCMHVTARSPAWVYNRWGVEVGFDGSQRNRQDRWRTTIGGQERTTGEHAKTVEVKELWVKAGRYKFGPGKGEFVTFPKGYVIVVADGKVLSHGENPYDHGDLPFVFIPALRVPGELWGDTIVNSLRVTQVSLNKTASQITLANDLCGNPQWLIPNDIKLKESDRTNYPGAYKVFEPQPHGLVPTMHPGQGPPAAVFRYLETLLSVSQQISGQHEGGLAGGTPPNVEAGIALAALIERDTSRLAFTAMEYGRGIERWTWLNMKLAQQFMTSPRMVSVAGKFMESEVVEFSGANIRDDFEVSVVPQSVQPQSKAARAQEAMQLLQLQLIGPKEALQSMGHDAPEDMTTEQMEIENARNEAFEARQFERVSTPVEWIQLENAEIHLEEHRRALLMPALRSNPKAWMALYEHWQVTQMLVQQALAEQQATAMAAAPPPGAGPEAAGAGPVGAGAPSVEPTGDMTSAMTVPPTG